MKLLIVNIGFLGDSILAGSFAENCKKNGFERVDLLIGFPQTLQLLKNNPYINNVFLSPNVGAHPEITLDTSIYDKIYHTDHLKFSEKPLDTFNKTFNLPHLDYPFDLYTQDIELPSKTKPRIAFQYDWHLRSFSSNNTPRNSQHIIDLISDKYEVFIIGDDTHFNINENTPMDFVKHCAIIKECDLFFGYPGGMHWVAGGVKTPSITTSEWVINHYKRNGEFKNGSFDDFSNQWMVHTGKHFTEPHILLEPEISDEDIIKYLLNYNI
jgi:ADP-heptose:LPS heptosyltransferase